MTAPTPVPDAAAVAAYLGNGATAERVEGPLAAEAQAQASLCVTEPYDAALAEALCRRVARNLAMRSVPLGVRTDPEGFSSQVSSWDPEIARLEAPRRRLVVA